MGILVVIVLAYKLLTKKSSKIDYREAYQAKQLLTKREYQEYLKLKQYADARNWMICPKVRLFDLVEPKRGAENRQTLINKVQSKHVDFVVCSQEMEVVCIIELDDKTHLRQNRMTRDQFVDDILKGTGYRIIHSWSIEPDIFDFLGEQTAEN